MRREPVRIFVPFVNKKMVNRFFVENSNLEDVDVQLIDNRQRNAGLPELYNEIISTFLEEDTWLMCVHEDWELKGELFDFGTLDKHAVYGTCGVAMNGHAPYPIGQHQCSEKDGSAPVEVGIAIDTPTPVDTFDCMAVLVHTQLLRQNPGLRFDENLTFDLYTEDFCLNARENFGLPSMVIPLFFQHYSKGNVTERYRRGLAHLARKYPDVAVPGTCSFIGGRAKELEANFTYDIAANPKELKKRRKSQGLKPLRRLKDALKKLRK